MLRALAQATVLLALGGEATGLAVLVHGVGDPVDAGIAADGLVLGAAALVLYYYATTGAPHCAGRIAPPYIVNANAGPASQHVLLQMEKGDKRTRRG